MSQCTFFQGCVVRYWRQYSSLFSPFLFFLILTPIPSFTPILFLHLVLSGSCSSLVRTSCVITSNEKSTEKAQEVKAEEGVWWIIDGGGANFCAYLMEQPKLNEKLPWSVTRASNEVGDLFVQPDIILEVLPSQAWTCNSELWANHQESLNSYSSNFILLNSFPQLIQSLMKLDHWQRTEGCYILLR